MSKHADMVSEVIDSLTEGWKEAKAEQVKRATPLYYWCQPFKDFQFPPQQFYGLVEKHICQWQVPELLQGKILLHEGTVFSKRRLYLQMRRERLVFEICVAPFGTGYFVSSRLFDRRRDAGLLDYLMAFILVALASAIAWKEWGTVPSVVITGVLVTTLWSVMRLGIATDFAWLDEKLCEIPWFGPIYETLFHPDTYYRQDRNNIYREAVHSAVIDSVAEMRAEKGLRPMTELESRPTIAELRRR
jgi:hypothetical protein